MSLTVPGAVAALETAFAELLGDLPSGLAGFEESARRISNACCWSA